MKVYATITAFLLSVTASAVAQEQAQATLTRGDQAPTLDVSVVKGEGAVLNSGVRVVEFWATWCPPCRKSIPHLTALQAKYESEGVTFIGITEEPKQVVMPFVESAGDAMDYTVAIDNDSKTTNALLRGFGVSSIPHAFLVNEDGIVVWNGHPMDPNLQRAIEVVLQRGKSGGKTPPPAPRAVSPKTAPVEAQATSELKGDVRQFYTPGQDVKAKGINFAWGDDQTAKKDGEKKD